MTKERKKGMRKRRKKKRKKFMCYSIHSHFSMSCTHRKMINYDILPLNPEVQCFYKAQMNETIMKSKYLLTKSLLSTDDDRRFIIEIFCLLEMSEKRIFFWVHLNSLRLFLHLCHVPSQWFREKCFLSVCQRLHSRTHLPRDNYYNNAKEE